MKVLCHHKIVLKQEGSYTVNRMINRWAHLKTDDESFFEPNPKDKADSVTLEYFHIVRSDEDPPDHHNPRAQQNMMRRRENNIVFSTPVNKSY